MIIGESPEPQPPHARVLLYCVAPEAMDGRGRRVRNEISTESDKNLCGALVETNTRLLVRCCPPSGAPKSQLPLLIRPQLFTARAKNWGVVPTVTMSKFDGYRGCLQRSHDFFSFRFTRKLVCWPRRQTSGDERSCAASGFRVTRHRRSHPRSVCRRRSL